ncbi:putative thiosulfate sulfurtransferase [Posidoniimonas corsicana]|uniref:Putative thiosulfate sulfurtransferase n=1 Tax=Posidoniimonas corsicana TaxID=1938618 RepID=A0A5C5VHQ8_9BACT|nr:rhodanese-like domain-containing protein [Posidoniimonas corsicana]TWT37409.1 putative thiosulfate sulfurtransferase [Posidoniimonas corsicana]
MRLACLLLFVAAPTLAAEPASYARPELLIEAAELQTKLGSQPRTLRNMTEEEARQAPPPLTLLDVRSAEEFKRGTIASAQRINVGEWKAAFRGGQDAAAWSKRLSEVLLAPNSTVIVFDDAVTPNAARAWWILKYWGVEDVRLLNGGVKAWRAAGSKLSLPTKAKTITQFTATPHPERLATADEVMACIGKGDAEACLIDTRTTGEHTAGYIPTACHTDWQEYVDPATGKIRSPEQLEELLARADFDRQRRTIAYCQSGGRASVVAFATELMGGRDVANYFGSWGEWSRLPEVPIARPGK